MLVIARTEALIAGLGQDEALARAQAYAEVGADAILIHSKSKTPEEIVSFCSAWKARGVKVPLVLVPTSYPQLSFKEIGELGSVGMVICGNHAIRAAVAGMQQCFQRIKTEKGIDGVQDDVVGVKDVFEVMGDARLRELESEYL